jgi:hypothetical protein
VFPFRPSPDMFPLRIAILRKVGSTFMAKKNSRIRSIKGRAGHKHSVEIWFPPPLVPSKNLSKKMLF